MFLFFFLAACSYSGIKPEPTPKFAPALLSYHAVRVFQGGQLVCSGVAIDTREVFTAAHCVDKDSGYTVTSETDPIPNPVIAARKPWYDFRDAVVLETLRPTETAPASLPFDGVPRMLSHAWIVGYGCDPNRLGIRPLVLLRRDGTEGRYQGKFCHGDSGGGVFDDYGRLIGLARSIIADADIAVVQFVLSGGSP